jgi:hypothetical protein
MQTMSDEFIGGISRAARKLEGREDLTTISIPIRYLPLVYRSLFQGGIPDQEMPTDGAICPIDALGPIRVMVKRGHPDILLTTEEESRRFNPALWASKAASFHIGNENFVGY